MDQIVQANLDRFRWLLETETDPTKRSMLSRLLAEENAKELAEVRGKAGIGHSSDLARTASADARR